jgi:AP2 domain/HNH endonuclease
MSRFEIGHKRGVKGFNDFQIIGEIVEIYIKDFVVLIDMEDLEKVRPYRWYITRDRYIRGENHLTGHETEMSRLILPCSDNKVIDHKNRDTLNNTKENLRVADKIQNAYNSIKREGCNSKFKGVSFRKNRGKWRAYITADKTTIHLGTFNSEIEAAIAYNKSAIKLHGEFAKLNEIP